ncbi:MAG: hypothetical protein GX491_05350 [Chloroflexi bacterium]|nr:hypothetical protein [Chloroflexota bacterium]
MTQEGVEKSFVFGRMIRSDAQIFEFGCSRNSIPALTLGSMIEVDLDTDTTIYAVISNIRYISDTMVAQLAAADDLPENVTENHRWTDTPVIEAVMIGFEQDGQIIQTLPPRPPVWLEYVRLCAPPAISRFTCHSLEYLQLLLNVRDLIPLPSVLAAHLASTHAINQAHQQGQWLQSAIDYLTGLLLLEYDLLLNVLSALVQQLPDIAFMDWGPDEP